MIPESEISECPEFEVKLKIGNIFVNENSYLLVNGTEIYKFKAKDSEIVPTPLCLGNISKDWF